MRDRNQTLGGLVMFIGGAAVLLFGFLQLQNARESSDWPNVKGQVLSSDVERRRYRTIDGTISGNTYLPRVVYIYSVNGIEHRSDKFSTLLIDHNTLKAAENDIAAFPPGSDIIVYYDPEEPRSAVLRPGASLGANFIIQSLVLLVIGTCTMFGARFSD